MARPAPCGEGSPREMGEPSGVHQLGLGKAEIATLGLQTRGVEACDLADFVNPQSLGKHARVACRCIACHGTRLAWRLRDEASRGTLGAVGRERFDDGVQGSEVGRCRCEHGQLRCRIVYRCG